jgi:hypothetical protein
MAITTSPRGTDPPRRSAANNKPEKVTTHPALKRKQEADGKAKVDDDDSTKSHDSRTMANIAKTARGPNGPERGSDTSSPPKTPARQLVSVDLTFNTESVLKV